MMFLLGVLFMAVGIAVSIALHEVGHLAPAKAFGVKVTKYMIGFGPTLWSRRKGETEYGVKAIPLGGFVSMVGMYPPKPGESISEAPTSRWSALIDDARAQGQAEIEPGDEDRVFYRLAWWKKLIVMAGGPTVNLIIATLLLGGIVTLYGSPTEVGAKVGSVVECVRPATSTAASTAPCTASDTPAPGAVGGLEPGDVVRSVNGTPIHSARELSSIIRPSAGKALTFVVDRGGRDQTLTITPIASQLPQLDSTGAPVKDAAGKVATVTAGYVGITNVPVTELQRQPVSAVPGIVWQGVSQTAGVVLQLPQKLVGVAQAAFGSGERDVNGPISVIGVGRVAGEISDGQVGAGIGSSPGSTLIVLLSLVASLNLALFVFNLVPLMPLDGGQMVGAVWEGIKKGFARMTGRPDPGYVDVAKALPVAYAVSVALIVMSALLMYADIVRPVKLG